MAVATPVVIATSAAAEVAVKQATAVASREVGGEVAVARVVHNGAHVDSGDA
jgi:hypothetical protein